MFISDGFGRPRVATSAVFIAVISAFLAWSSAPAHAQQGFGRPLTEAEQNNLPPMVFANGAGLPLGGGSVADGAPLYKQHCAACHGPSGEGGSALELVGDRSLLSSEYPDKGVAVYWPYAATLFTYIRRAMPPGKPYSLTVNETYSVIAKVLHLNGLLDNDGEVDHQTLADLEMPNRNGFQDVYRVSDSTD